MTIGFLQINGSGPRNAAVAVYDSEDSLIAETQSDERGFWSVASVPMEVGTHQLRAKMRSTSGRTHISNDIQVQVDDPDADVSLQAEQWAPEDVEAMCAMEAERERKAALRASFEAYDRLVEESVCGHEVSSSQLMPILSALGLHSDAFWAEVASERSKREYTRIVCTMAAGIALEDKDKQSIWRTYSKSEEQFAEDVGRVKWHAGARWRTSLNSEETNSSP
jgi:predicted RNA-binding Zn ribbon-like protein